MELTDNIYVDNFVSNGVEYCYEVEAIYAGDASDLAGPTCATPEAQTIYEIFMMMVVLKLTLMARPCQWQLNLPQRHIR